MKAHWRRITYVAFWIVLLALAFPTFLSAESDNEARAVLLSILTVLAMPISAVFVGVLAMMASIFPNAYPTIMEALAGNRLIELSVWWLAMVGISYWQWFHLVPRLLSIFRRWINRGQDDAVRPGMTKT